MARKLKLTKTLIDDICENISNGIPNKYAAIGAGLAEGTFYKYLNQAEELSKKIENGEKIAKKDEIFIEFKESIKKANFDFINFHLDNIKKNSNKDWKASGWLLERRFFEYFGKKEKTIIEGKIEEIHNISPEVKKELEEFRRHFTKLSKK
jgi:hypothetical protein